ncbi:MAG: class I SAM-dependent methyltransferase [Terriglobales bacterium]
MITTQVGEFNRREKRASFPLQPYIPMDHSRQVTAEHCLRQLFATHKDLRRVMDLGCGSGDSVDLFREKIEEVKWVGLDIESSPEVMRRTRADAEFRTFDGVQIPYETDSFDLVYSRQVFEHVRRPAELLKEVHRVLRPTGLFVGSTSHLEPYHSYSFWNYTPLGFSELLQEAGFQLVEMRPGIDALTLLVRRALGCPKVFDRFFRSESPLNLVIELASRIAGKSRGWSNAAKLLFSGHFCFLAAKRED